MQVIWTAISSIKLSISFDWDSYSRLSLALSLEVNGIFAIFDGIFMHECLKAAKKHTHLTIFDMNVKMRFMNCWLLLSDQ